MGGMVYPLRDSEEKIVQIAMTVTATVTVTVAMTVTLAMMIVIDEEGNENGNCAEKDDGCE